MLPSKEFWDRVLAAQTRQVSHVAHSIQMLGTLPGAMTRTADSCLRIACLESFLVHARLLIEFLLVQPGNAVKDFSARDFGWTGPPDTEWGHLKGVWLLASRHLVHFSKERTPASVHELQAADTSQSGLCAIGGDVLGLVELFVVDLESRGHDEGATFRRALEQAKSELAAVRET